MIEPSGFNMESLLRGLLGMVSILAVCYALSSNRRQIDWKLAGVGLLLQLILALSVLYVPIVGLLFEWAGRAFVKLMDFTHEGLVFLLGPYAERANGFSFLLHSLPIVIFFSALVSLFYHWGIIQRVVGFFSWVLRRFMKISGAEGLIAAGNIFMGMTESPVLIKNYLPRMNRSEIFLVMVSGMGTIAGSVMGTYIGMLGGDNPAEKVMFAKHLLSASVMAAPGAIVIAKMLCPQTEAITDDKTVTMEKSNEQTTALGALATGTTTGVKLMVNIAAMLLVFIGIVALVNYISSDLIGHYTGINQWITDFTGGKSNGLTFQFIVGIILAPFMWLTGVPVEDITVVGSLLGQKTILNEFVAYAQMEQWKSAGLFVYEKSMIMSTYILCGFANISSIGILLGGMSVLAPEKKDMIIRSGFPAMIGGALVSILSATVIGMIMG
ncbi:MAG: Na+ dependent nucleoside transporter [Tannerellaceae bacterium]|jgi:CNT family concentrative nucleoside transporter|nr:Na+ dependent nucleoside transporter [Tannerellaceae bacterium]